MSAAGHGARRDVDWAGLRRRLAAVETALEGSTEMAPEEAAELLAARARELARAPAAATPRAARSFVTFALGDETYAVEAASVRGVFRLADLAPLAGAPDGIAGLTLWRGELLVVLDLRRALGLSGAGLDDRAWVVAVGDERRSVGLLAGALGELEPVVEEDVREAEQRSGAGLPVLVRGVTPTATQLLDTRALLELETEEVR